MILVSVYYPPSSRECFGCNNGVVSTEENGFISVLDPQYSDISDAEECDKIGCMAFFIAIFKFWFIYGE